MNQLDNVPDFVIFLGRFHPLLVHLPIGMLIIGVLMYFLAKKEKFQHLIKSVPFVLALGAISAIISCVLGYLLSFQGGYDDDALSNHQWLGIGVTVISILAYGTSIWKKTIKNHVVNSLMMISILIGLSITGHLGGNLTHGSTYLTQYAPAPVRSVIGLAPKPEKRPPVTVIDSADIFLDVIQPLISNKCTSCHNPQKLKGGLLLTSHTEMLKGGENGPSIVAGNLKKSELFNRITLPEHHKDFMPPEGKRPFSEDDLKLIEFWILDGAKSNGFLANINLEDKQTELFENFLGIENSNNGLLNRVVEAADSSILKSLKTKGFKIKTISNTSHLLEVSIPYGEQKAAKHIKALLAIKNQIVFLNLNNLNLQDEDLKPIGQLELLTKLDLHSNPNISSQGISNLSNLQNLEALNIYNTSADNESLKDISKLKQLKRLYIWNTKITSEIIEEFQDSHIGLNISFGASVL